MPDSLGKDNLSKLLACSLLASSLYCDCSIWFFNLQHKNQRKNEGV